MIGGVGPGSAEIISAGKINNVADWIMHKLKIDYLPMEREDFHEKHCDKRKIAYGLVCITIWSVLFYFIMTM